MERVPEESEVLGVHVGAQALDGILEFQELRTELANALSSKGMDLRF